MEMKSSYLIVLALALLFIWVRESNRSVRANRLIRRAKRMSVKRIMRRQFEQERDNA